MRIYKLIFLIVLSSYHVVYSDTTSCKNGGLQLNDGSCLCQGLFEGINCEILKCVSGGYLDTTFNKCICPKGYIGFHCEGSSKHPKPPNIFSSTDLTFNMFVYGDSTPFYGKTGLNTFKQIAINHITSNKNNYKTFRFHYDYSKSDTFNEYVETDSNIFISQLNTTIVPQLSKSYACYTVEMYKAIIDMIQKYKIKDSPLVIYTQHPPSDYDTYKEQLEELVVAFKIRITILFQNDLLINPCDEMDPVVGPSFSALKDITFLSGGLFYQLDSDSPSAGIQHSFDILFNPQLVYYGMENDCSKGLSIQYQSDNFVLYSHLIIQSDTVIDLTKTINSLFNVISYSYDNKTITLQSTSIQSSKNVQNNLQLANIPGKCSVQYISTYPSVMPQQGVDIYYSYIPYNIVSNDGKDSAYLFMSQNTQNVINFNIELQATLSKMISSNNAISSLNGDYLTETSIINLVSTSNTSNSIFGYTFGDSNLNFKCDVNKRSWFVIEFQLVFGGKPIYYQRYVPVKCFDQYQMYTTIDSSTESIPILSTLSTLLSPTPEDTTISTTVSQPLSRTATFGLIASCGVSYSVAMPYLNGIASLRENSNIQSFFSNGYLYFSDNSVQTPQTATFYPSFVSFTDEIRTFNYQCKASSSYDYIDMFTQALNMVQDDKFKKNSPLVLFPVGGTILPNGIDTLLRDLIQYSVAKRISIYIFNQYDMTNNLANDAFASLVKATNGHMFYLNHNLKLQDGTYFAQSVVTDFFTNIYPNKLIQSRTMTNDYSVSDYGTIKTKEVKDIIITVSSDSLEIPPTNGYYLNLKLYNSKNEVTNKILTNFNNSNDQQQYTNYEYVIFKDLPPDTYRISLQALIHPLRQISIRVWEVIDINNNYEYIDISYLSVTNNVVGPELMNGPDKDNSIVINSNIFYNNNTKQISSVTYTFKQLTQGPAANDIIMTPINSVNQGTINRLSDTKYNAVFNPIIDLTKTDPSFIDTKYSWPIYKVDVEISFSDQTLQSYTFNTVVQGDYKDFKTNINYQKFTQGVSNQFYYCENQGELKFNFNGNKYSCLCQDSYGGNSCEIVNTCPVVTNYPGKNDDVYRILTVVLATGNGENTFFNATADLINKFKDDDVKNIWQFRLYYYNEGNIVSYYIGTDLSAFQSSFSKVSQLEILSSPVCVSEIKNAVYKYLPSSVKGLIWIVTDDIMTESTSPAPTDGTTIKVTKGDLTTIEISTEAWGTEATNTGTMGTVTTDSGTAETVTADTATMGTVTADTVTMETVTAGTATMGTVTSDTGTEGTITMNSGTTFTSGTTSNSGTSLTLETTLYPATISGSTTTPKNPPDENCPDDLTNGYNQDLFYIYHKIGDNDYLSNNNKILFNGGAPLKFGNDQEYETFSQIFLQKILGGSISINNYMEKLDSEKTLSIEDTSTSAYVLVMGNLDSKSSITSSIATSKYVSLYDIKNGDKIDILNKNNIAFFNTYVIDGLNVDVAYLRANNLDEPSSIPSIFNVTYALYPPENVDDISVIQDNSNSYKMTRNGCSYKYSFTQQTVGDSQEKLTFNFIKGGNTYQKVYPNNQVYTKFESLIQSTALPITCRNGNYSSYLDNSLNTVYNCECNNNFHGIDCSIPICQNGGRLNGMKNSCDCSNTNFYGEFCEEAL